VSIETLYNWVMPLGIAGFGLLYALWAARTYDRNMDRWEREQAAKKSPAGE
jgi:hypothetical protein